VSRFNVANIRSRDQSVQRPYLPHHAACVRAAWCRNRSRQRPPPCLTPYTPHFSRAILIRAASRIVHLRVESRGHGLDSNHPRRHRRRRDVRFPPRCAPAFPMLTHAWQLRNAQDGGRPCLCRDVQTLASRRQRAVIVCPHYLTAPSSLPRYHAS
jgi:hypothetical protein